MVHAYIYIIAIYFSGFGRPCSNIGHHIFIFSSLSCTKYECTKYDVFLQVFFSFFGHHADFDTILLLCRIISTSVSPKKNLVWGGHILTFVLAIYYFSRRLCIFCTQFSFFLETPMLIGRIIVPLCRTAVYGMFLYLLATGCQVWGGHAEA